MITPLPADYDRCAGIGSDEEGWFEDCETCLRRTSPGGENHMAPPRIITLFCPYQLQEGDPLPWLAGSQFKGV